MASLFDEPAGEPPVTETIEAGCHVAVTDNADGTVSIAVTASTLAGPGLSSTTVEPPACSQLQVNAGDGLEIVGDDVAVDLAANNPGLEFSAGELRAKAEVRTHTTPVSIVDAAASTATPERPTWINKYGVAVTIASIWIANRTTLAADAANNFTISFFRRTAAGVQTTIVTATNNAGGLNGLVAFIGKSLGALANNILADGDSITYEITKAGTGQTLNAAVTITFTTPG